MNASASSSTRQNFTTSHIKYSSPTRARFSSCSFSLAQTQPHSHPLPSLIQAPQKEADAASRSPPSPSPSPSSPSSSSSSSPPPSSFLEVARVKDSMGLQDTDLLSTPQQQAWVAATCSALLLAFTRGLVTAVEANDVLAFSLTVLLAYVLADFGTGCYHFGVDNYGSASTPVFGPQIDAFQGHHRRPWTITRRQFANNLHLLARTVFFFILPALLLLPGSAVRDAFLSVFLACVMFSQQFHAWAHTPKTLLPPAVVALQDAGLLVPRRMHGQHHRSPFNVNYCIVSGLCNYPLDAVGFFTALEQVIFRVTGVPSRSWCADLHVEGTYFEDGSPSE